MISLGEALTKMGIAKGEKSAPLPWNADDQWQAVYDRCESPIERLMCLGIHGYLGYEARAGQFDQTKPPESDRRAGALVYGQHEIAGDWQLGYSHGIRADFLIVGFVRPEPMAKLIVECDGAAFHDAGADAKRDAYLRLLGYEVVRFSGSEITRQLADKIGRIPARFGRRYAWWIATEYGSATLAEMTDDLERVSPEPRRGQGEDAADDGFSGNWQDCL